jgi:hypothetical protein
LELAPCVIFAVHPLSLENIAPLHNNDNKQKH